MLAKVDTPEGRAQSVNWRTVFLSFAVGARDYSRAPLIGASFGVVIALAGLIILVQLYVLHAPWLSLPFLTGAPLLTPFAAAGFYETSRVIEQGGRPRFRGVYAVVWQQRQRQLAWIGFVWLVLVWVWMYLLRILYALLLETAPEHTLREVLAQATSSSAGIALLAIAFASCAILAFISFSISVLAMPLLFETNMDFVEAIKLSAQFVRANIGPMLVWGGVATILLILAVLPGFLGLLVVAPMLGHATWFLYRAAFRHTATSEGP